MPWNITAGVDVNNVFDRDPPAVLSAVTNLLDSASAFQNSWPHYTQRF
ncbi:hypothetical protein [Xanthomonas campestris]|nr:hypothetical protein [Xanthomonas campestris]WDI92965.1 hypothetical protein JH280_17115 [Xanthomonas campestris]